MLYKSLLALIIFHFGIRCLFLYGTIFKKKEKGANLIAPSSIYKLIIFFAITRSPYFYRRSVYEEVHEIDVRLVCRDILCI